MNEKTRHRISNGKPIIQKRDVSETVLNQLVAEHSTRDAICCVIHESWQAHCVACDAPSQKMYSLERLNVRWSTLGGTWRVTSLSQDDDWY